MKLLQQKLMPGIVGVSTYVDFAYQKAMQQAAVAAAGTSGPVNQLRSVTATLDFNALIEHLRGGRREAAEELVSQACATLAAAGCDFIVVTSGTTSTLAGPARRSLAVPFLDIAAPCFLPARPDGPIGLLATRYTVTAGIFHTAAEQRGVQIVTPSAATAARVDDVIFGELVRGGVGTDGFAVFKAALDELGAAGARSVMLGNTDLTLIVEELRRACALPLIDSAIEHARAAARAAMTGDVVSC